MNPCLSVQAGVSDNVQNSSLEQTIGSYSDTAESQTVFGVLKEILTILVSLDAKISSLDSKVQNTYIAASTIKFQNSQVCSTKIVETGPTSILVKWDCSKDADCTVNSTLPDRIQDDEFKEFHVYYSTINAAVRNMVYSGKVAYNEGQFYTDDYSYEIQGLDPECTYYVWVTACIDDGYDTELTDNSAVRVCNTTSMKAIVVKDLEVNPIDGETLEIIWKDGLLNSNMKSDLIDCYKVFYSTEELNTANVSSCSAFVSTTSCSATITDLQAGTYYQLAVVPVMFDPKIEHAYSQACFSGCYTAYVLTYSIQPTNASVANTAISVVYTDTTGDTVTLTSGTGQVLVKPNTTVSYRITSYYNDYWSCYLSCYFNGICCHGCCQSAAYSYHTCTLDGGTFTMNKHMNLSMTAKYAGQSTMSNPPMDTYGDYNDGRYRNVSYTGSVEIN